MKRWVNFAVIMPDNVFNSLFFFLGGETKEAEERLGDALSLSSALAECEIVFLNLVVMVVVMIVDSGLV